METNTTETVVTVGKRGKKLFVVPEGITVDWTQTNKVVATQLGISPMTAFNLRKRLGVTSNKRGRRKTVQG